MFSKRICEEKLKNLFEQDIYTYKIYPTELFRYFSIWLQKNVLIRAMLPVCFEILGGSKRYDIFNIKVLYWYYRFCVVLVCNSCRQAGENTEATIGFEFNDPITVERFRHTLQEELTTNDTFYIILSSATNIHGKWAPPTYAVTAPPTYAVRESLQHTR